MTRLRLAWARWRLAAARDALTAALPYARPKFISNVAHQITDLEHDIAVLST